MLCEQTGTQFSGLLSAAEQHHITMTLIASEAARAIHFEGPAGAAVAAGSNALSEISELPLDEGGESDTPKAGPEHQVEPVSSTDVAMTGVPQ